MAGDGEVAAAAAALARGEVVGLPTETFYALAADALDVAALERLLVLKGREAAHTVSVLIDGEAMLASLVSDVPAAARRLMARHWPGPLTIALPARAGLPGTIVSARGLVAVRWSPAELATAVVTALGRPVTATSANVSGQPPARSADEVRRAFPALPVFGTECPGGLPLTLVAVTGAGVELLRAGAIPEEAL